MRHTLKKLRGSWARLSIDQALKKYIERSQGSRGCSFENKSFFSFSYLVGVVTRVKKMETPLVHLSRQSSAVTKTIAITSNDVELKANILLSGLFGLSCLVTLVSVTANQLSRLSFCCFLVLLFDWPRFFVDDKSVKSWLS